MNRPLHKRLTRDWHDDAHGRLSGRPLLASPALAAGARDVLAPAPEREQPHPELVVLRALIGPKEPKNRMTLHRRHLDQAYRRGYDDALNDHAGAVTAVGRAATRTGFDLGRQGDKQPRRPAGRPDDHSSQEPEIEKMSAQTQTLAKNAEDGEDDVLAPVVMLDAQGNAMPTPVGVEALHSWSAAESHLHHAAIHTAAGADRLAALAGAAEGEDVDEHAGAAAGHLDAAHSHLDLAASHLANLRDAGLPHGDAENAHDEVADHLEALHHAVENA